jgi:carboxypeptidase family protein
VGLVHLGRIFMKRILHVVLGGLVIPVLGCSFIWAQATAQISGTVKDQTGAVLPGVEVTATQTDTGISRSAVTNETGSYVLPNLAIGPYRVEASLPGFRTFAQTGLVLQVNASPVVNPILEVGQVTEQVEVQANAAMVETRTAGIGAVVENARILDLPLNGRAVVELIALSGAATPAPLNNGSSRDHFAQASFSVAGGLNNGLNYTLDGATHNNPQDNGYLSIPFPDALQEFKLETSGTGAQTGMKSAGTVSLVTKSGTNMFHGDLFEFVRNGKFNARNAFATRRDTIKRNQFGGTVGGPIITNKLFFFGGYQATRLRQDPSDSIAFVPTASMMAGDFTDFASAACNGGRAQTLRAPFVNNRIDPALFSKPAALFAAKLPKTSDPCGKLIYTNPTLTNEYQAVGKIDYQLSAKHSVFGRYLAHHVYAPAAYDLSHNPLTLANTEAGLATDSLAQSVTLGSTYLFSSNIVNAFRLTANRIADGKFESPLLQTAGLGPADVGIKAYHYSPHSPRITVTGGFSSNSFGGSTRGAIFGANDDLSVLRGNHQLAFGGQATLWWNNSYSTTNHESNSFTGATTGLGMSDFLMGNVASYNAGTTGIMAKRGKYIGTYVADTWKVNQKLTFNYGLRWEPYFPLIPLGGGAIHYDEAALKKGIKSSQYDNTPPGVFFIGDAGWHTGRSDTEVLWKNFSPRVGLAWDVNGDGRTSVRASVGTFYDFPSTNYQNPATAPPWSPRFTLSDVNYADPWGKFAGGDPFPVKFGKDITRDVQWPFYGLVTATDYRTKNMRVTSWNLSVQRQVGTDWLVSANYLGNETYHMWSAQQLNAPVFLGLGPCTLAGIQYTTCSTAANLDQRRRLSIENPNVGKYYGYVVHLDYGGTASYNGLLLSVQRRATRGVTVNANYTWSHCISDTGAGDNKIFGATPNTSWQDPSNRRFDRGNCGLAATDRRQVFNLSSVMETPRFSSKALRFVGSGWRFSPLVKIMTGGYLLLTTSQDRALSGTTNQRVNQVLGNPYGDKSVSNYLNPAAFALPATGTLGNVGSYSVRGPGLWQFDMSVSRTIQLREAQKLELRGEAFNVTNSFHMQDPTTVLNSNTFGQVTSARDPRIMQFALKYFF